MLAVRVHTKRPVQKVQARTMPPKAVKVPPPTPPNEEVFGPPLAMHRPRELQEPTPIHALLVR